MNLISNYPLKALILALGLVAVSACQSESQLTTVKPVLSSQQQGNLLIEAKQAILAHAQAQAQAQVSDSRPVPRRW